MDKQGIIDIVASHTTLKRSDLTFAGVISNTTNARVVVVETKFANIAYCIKLSKNPRVSFVKELKRSRIIEDCIPNNTSHVIAAGYQHGYHFLISECQSLRTLSQNFQNNAMQSTRYSAEIIATLVELWQVKRIDFVAQPNSRCHFERKKRVFEGVENFFKDLESKNKAIEININKISHYKNLANQAKSFVENIDHPNFGVLCHGDAHPNNVVVNDISWWLVDFEWSGINHDWRLCFAQIFGWWITEISFVTKQNRSSISTDICLAQLRTLSAYVKPMICHNNDIVAIEQYIVLLLLGHLRQTGTNSVSQSLLYLEICNFIIIRKCHYLEILRNV